MSQCLVFRQQFPNIVPPSPPTSNTSQPSMKYGVKGYTPLHVPKEYTASAPLPQSSGLLLDSGASHHVTNDLENLSLHTPYGRSEKLIIEDGFGLPISNTGSFSLLLNFTSLHFNNVLHVPSALRNIISFKIVS